jgi:hypothetical protein
MLAPIYADTGRRNGTRSSLLLRAFCIMAAWLCAALIGVNVGVAPSSNDDAHARSHTRPPS